MPVTASLLIMGSNSLPLTTIMIMHPSVVHVHLHMVEDGGFTGQDFEDNKTFHELFIFSCFEANLNGEYFTEDEENGYYRGIIWELWLGDYSLKETKMMVRPLTFNSNVGQEETYWTPADP